MIAQPRDVMAVGISQGTMPPTAGAPLQDVTGLDTLQGIMRLIGACQVVLVPRKAE